MKAGILVAALVGLAAVPAAAQQETVVIGPMAEQDDPATLINGAAALVHEGKFAQAREIYERIERMPIDYKLETTQGSWMFPAEIARRGLKEVEVRQRRVILASAR